MKNPASRSCTMRCAPKPSAAPSTAAGATSEPTGIARMSVTSTSDHDEQQRDRHPGDHRRDGLAVLGALRAHQLVAFLEVGVDAPDDPVGRPVDEPGHQQRRRSPAARSAGRGSRIQSPMSPRQKPCQRSAPESNASTVLFVIFSVAPTDSRLEESVDVAVEYRRGVADLVLGAQVLDHLVRAAARRSASGCPTSCRRRP